MSLVIHKKIIKFFLIIFLLFILLLTVYIIKLQTSIRNHAAMTSLVADENRIAGIDAHGLLNSNKALNMLLFNPDRYNQLKAQGLIANPAYVEAQYAKQRPMKPSPFLAVRPATQLSNNITSCGSITASGTFTLASDISSSNASGPCLTIQGTQTSPLTNITLDCNGHTITTSWVLQNNGQYPAVYIHFANNVSVTNCNITNSSATDNLGYEAISADTVNGITVTKNNLTSNPFYTSNQTIKNAASLPLTFSSVKNGTITNNIINGAYTEIKNNSNIQIINNTMSSIDSHYNDHLTIDKNNISLPAGISGTYGISSNFDSYLVVTNNTINGMWDGVARGDKDAGFDDAIIFGNGIQTTISNNTLSNLWDAGVETAGIVNSATISNNTIKNTGICGIGGWYSNSWLNNTVQNNTADTVPLLFLFFRRHPLEKNEQYVYFENNTFTGNVLTNPRTSEYNDFYSTSIDFQNLTTGLSASQIKADNNTFDNNNFGTITESPYIIPTTLIVDKKNNICKIDTLMVSLQCVGSSISSSPTTSVSPSPSVSDTINPSPSISDTLSPSPAISGTTTPTPSNSGTPTPSPSTNACSGMNLQIDPTNCGVNKNGIGLFCGGNCGVVGDANTLYQCNGTTEMAEVACSPKCITCPLANQADQCGANTKVCGPGAPNTPITSGSPVTSASPTQNPTALSIDVTSFTPTSSNCSTGTTATPSGTQCSFNLNTTQSAITWNEITTPQASSQLFTLSSITGNVSTGTPTTVTISFDSSLCSTTSQPATTFAFTDTNNTNNTAQTVFNCTAATTASTNIPLSVNTGSVSPPFLKTLYATVMAAPVGQAQTYALAPVLGTQVYKVSGPLKYDSSSGNFINPHFSLGPIPQGRYNLILHIDTFLDKKLTLSDGSDIFTIIPRVSLNRVTTSLISGDIAPASSGDNYIDILDYNMLISCIQNSNFCTKKKKLGDLNNDGVIDQKDLQIIISHIGLLGDSFSIPQFICVTDPSCKQTGTGTLQLCPLTCTKKITR